MALSDNLKKIREMKGITTGELAECAGIAQQQISKYEAGAAIPNAITAAAIAKRLGVTVEQLVNGKESECNA